MRVQQYTKHLLHTLTNPVVLYNAYPNLLYPPTREIDGGGTYRISGASILENKINLGTFVDSFCYYVSKHLLSVPL